MLSRLNLDLHYHQLAVLPDSLFGNSVDNITNQVNLICLNSEQIHSPY